MANVIHVEGGNSISMGASATNYFRLTSNCQNSNSGTESTRNMTWRVGGVLKNLYINILTNDRDASTFRTRKATANANLVVSITGSTTGKFEDTVNTDVVTAADDWHCSIVTGANGTVFTFRFFGVLFSATTNTTQRWGGGGAGNYATASTTNPGCFYGDGGVNLSASDSAVGITAQTDGTLKNLFVRITGNARTNTTTFRSRVASGFGNLTLDVAASTTGTFEDTSNSDTIASGNLVNWSVTTGTGTEAITINTVITDFLTKNNQQQYTSGIMAGISQGAGVTSYYGFSGVNNGSATESNVIIESNLAFTGSLLQCNVSANTIALDSTIRLRQSSGGSGYGNQIVTITALTTGIFQDTVNTDAILATDNINYEIVTPSSLTSITINSISMLGDASISRSINIIERKTFRGVLRGVGRGSV